MVKGLARQGVRTVTFAPAFALLDALVASVLLGLGLAAIIGLTGAALASQARGEHLQIASMLADERLNLVLATGPERYRSIFDMRGRCDEPFESYEYELDIELGPTGRPAVVTVEIAWETGGKERAIEIEALIAPRLGPDPDPDRSPEETLERQT